jgi:hypothetical protein
MTMMTTSCPSADDRQRDDDEAFACGQCGAVFGERHQLFLVRHRVWNVDECSNCGKPYQTGRANCSQTRVLAYTGTEFSLPHLAWLAVNDLLHGLGLISYQQFQAMQLSVGAGPDAEAATWLTRCLKQEIADAEGPRKLIARETEFEDGEAREFWFYLREFLHFAATSGGFSVY